MKSDTCALPMDAAARCINILARSRTIVRHPYSQIARLSPVHVATLVLFHATTSDKSSRSVRALINNSHRTLDVDTCRLKAPATPAADARCPPISGARWGFSHALIVTLINTYLFVLSQFPLILWLYVSRLTTRTTPRRVDSAQSCHKQHSPHKLFATLLVSWSLTSLFSTNMAISETIATLYLTAHRRLPLTILGQPFGKRFALCYRTAVYPVCLSCLSVLSVTLVYYGQTLDGLGCHLVRR